MKKTRGAILFCEGYIYIYICSAVAAVGNYIFNRMRANTEFDGQRERYGGFFAVYIYMFKLGFEVMSRAPLYPAGKETGSGLPNSRNSTSF